MSLKGNVVKISSVTLLL